MTYALMLLGAGLIVPACAAAFALGLRRGRNTARAQVPSSTAEVAPHQLMAHEIRTPLALILGASELIGTEGALSARQQELLETVTVNTRRAVDIAEAFLLEARMSQPGFAPDLAPLDLRALTRHTAQELREVTPVPILLTDPGDPILVHGDERLLRQALWNLIGNAARHAPSTGTVRVRTYTSVQEAGLQVTDVGPGLTPQHRAEMFRPFTQGPASRSGAGLGLSITQKIVAEHGGRIVVDTICGHGTSIHVLLPLPAQKDAA